MPFSEMEGEARRRDEADALRPFRDRFYIPPDRIYLDGNSLGLLSREAEGRVLGVLEEWKRQAVEGWTEATPPWFFLAEELSQGVAPLVGAEADEVIVTGGTTVNLHQLLATLFAPEPGRDKILADALAFPSDIYAIQSHLRLRGLDPRTQLVRVPSHDGRTLDEDDILSAMTGDIGLAVLPSVIYTSGQLLDMERLTREARRRGIVIGWDCSHSVGVVPHALSEWGADFAFWCHYKYLNAGPGSVGGLYLNRRHFDRAPGLAGWFGSNKERQFEMAHEFTPAAGAGALQIGTPPILSLAPLQGALALHQEARIQPIRQKSLAMTAFLRVMVERELSSFGVTVITPRKDFRRGGHIALVHAEAARIGRALRRAGVVPDFRPPDILRLAPAPLYTSFAECAEAMRRLNDILQTRSYADEEPERKAVP